MVARRFCLNDPHWTECRVDRGRQAHQQREGHCHVAIWRLCINVVVLRDHDAADSSGDEEDAQDRDDHRRLEAKLSGGALLGLRSDRITESEGITMENNKKNTCHTILTHQKVLLQHYRM